MAYEVQFTGPARRALQSIPPRVVPAIIEFAFGDLAREPHRVGKPLERELSGLFGARRGPYRLLYRIDDEAQRIYIVRRPPSGRLPPALNGIPRRQRCTTRLARPIDDELAAAIAIQQDSALARWPDGNVLFPMTYANPTGTAHKPRYLRGAAAEMALSCDVRDEAGRPARPTPHQFRHTYATVLTNNDVPQYVVQELLDHDSATMTARYGRLSQQTIRRHREGARKAGISGEVTGDTSGPLADAVWLKNSLSRAKMALPNGYCTLPLQQTCEYANTCLTCPMFLTTADFLPEHRRQLAETQRLLEHAEQHGQQRVLQMNRIVERQNMLGWEQDVPGGMLSSRPGWTAIGHETPAVELAELIEFWILPGQDHALRWRQTRTITVGLPGFGGRWVRRFLLSDGGAVRTVPG